MRCELCGRLALALPRHGRFRSRKARAGKPYCVQAHTLCQQCWEKLNDQLQAQRLARLGEEEMS